jgi:stearoyl-CoA desaturase (delta-9 desaturase)
VLPFVVLHLTPLLLFFVPFKGSLVLLAAGTYYARMLFVTLGYHRYFAHRSFQTSRAFAVVLAALAQLSGQKGVLWWASHHRHHHKTSDQPGDVHTPVLRGFWWSHIGWLMCGSYDAPRFELVKDLARFPELRFIDKHWWWFPLAGVVGLFALGGLPYLVWGGFISTLLLFHATFAINSLSHVLGRRRYLTTDASRNNALLAVLTCGEGWHNNHHHHQSSARQGWFWWELDTSYYLLRVLEAVGLVWKVKRPEAQTRYAYLRYTPEQRDELARQSRFAGRLSAA